MTLLDVKAIKETAKKEIADETAKAAVEKLKGLYRTREKAALALRNIDREIEGYLADVAENEVYEAAGVKTTKE